MHDAHFADGFDGRDRIAFGLGAAELGVVVCGALVAYGLSRVLPGAVGVPLSICVGLLSAALGWLRIGGRPALEWVGFAALYALRRTEGSLTMAIAAGSVVPAGTAAAPITRLPARRPPRVLALFSIKGGVGRTTLAIELAKGLAGRGQRVALLDLDERCPSVAIRLGIPAAQPAAPGARVLHTSGVHVQPWAAQHGGDVRPLLEALQQDRFDAVICDLAAAAGLAVLGHADQVLLVVVPSPAGVLDAYRSAALLRRHGAGGRISLVLNRCGDTQPLDEVIGDLRLPVAGCVPDDPALADLVSSGSGAAGPALEALTAGLAAAPAS